MPLVVCATPIGNLGDVTLRVLDALRDADAVLCEDTRRTQILLDRYEIRAKRLVSVHRHNEARRVARAAAAHVSAGETHALVSDAGLPGRQRSGRPARDGCDRRGRSPSSSSRGRARSRRRWWPAGSRPREYRFLGYLPRRDAELDALWDDSTSWTSPRSPSSRRDGSLDRSRASA